MDDTEKLRRELAMQSALAATIIENLEGRKASVPVQIAGYFVHAYRSFGTEEGKRVLKAVADELAKSK